MATLSEKKSKRMEVDFTNPYPAFPREVFFDLNNTCNSRCFFCSNRKVGERANLDQKLAFRLMQEFYDMGTREIALHATGEPFLRDDLADFVREAKRIGFEYVFLSSNGILATPERAKPVLDAGLDSIKFSVNAGTKESYKRIHGIDRFDAVIENIRWFHSYRRESGLGYKIYASMVPSSKSRDEWNALSHAIKDSVDELDLRGCSNQGGNMLENNETEDIDPDNLLGSLQKSQYTGRCPDVFFRCTVTPQGYLSACVVDYQNYLVVADLHVMSAKEAWHSDAFVQLRKRHMHGDLEGLMCSCCLTNKAGESEPLDHRYVNPFRSENKKVGA